MSTWNGNSLNAFKIKERILYEMASNSLAHAGTIAVRDGRFY